MKQPLYQIIYLSPHKTKIIINSFANIFNICHLLLYIHTFMSVFSFPFLRGGLYAICYMHILHNDLKLLGWLWFGLFSFFWYRMEKRSKPDPSIHFKNTKYKSIFSILANGYKMAYRAHYTFSLSYLTSGPCFLYTSSEITITEQV
jgi:hypothetical protein